MTASRTSAGLEGRKDGHTALMSAAAMGNPAIAQAVVDDGWTVLCIAVEGGSPDVIKTLVEANADLTARTPHGFMPLKLAEVWYKQSGGKTEYKTIADCLSGKGAK